MERNEAITTLEEQLRMLNAMKAELLATKESIGAIKKGEIVVSIGAGIMAHVKPTDAPLLVPVGAGIYVERTPDDAVKEIDERVEKIEAQIKRVQEELRRVAQRGG